MKTIDAMKQAKSAMELYHSKWNATRFDSEIDGLSEAIKHEEAQTVEPRPYEEWAKGTESEDEYEARREGYDAGLQAGLNVRRLVPAKQPLPTEREALIDQLRAFPDEYSPGYADGLVIRAADMLAADGQRISELDALSVTNILVDVVPGWDGEGQEIFAKSTDEVVNLLTDLSGKLDAVQQVAVQQGWKLTPYALDDAMRQAAHDCLAGGKHKPPGAVYQAVWKAAPQPPPQADAKQDDCDDLSDGEIYSRMSKAVNDRMNSVRVPMTSQEIEKCWTQVKGTAFGYAPFARAIEAHHGIKAVKP